MRWDELVLRIEWNCEMETLLKRDDISKEDKTQIEEAIKDFNYCFNTGTVDRWLSDKK